MSRKDMIKSRKPKATKEAPISPAIPAASKRLPKPAKEKTKPSAGRRVLNFIKKAVPCTSSGAKHHVEEPAQDVSQAIEVAVAPRPLQQESFKALSPISLEPQVSKVGEVAVAHRPVKQESFKAILPNPHVADREKTTSPVASGSTPTSGNGAGLVLNPVGVPASNPAPLPIAPGDPSTVNGGSTYKPPTCKIDIYDMGHLGGTKGEYIAMPEDFRWTTYAPPPELKMALAAEKSKKAPAPIPAAVKPPIASSSTSTPLSKRSCKKSGPTVRFLSTVHYQTLSALKEADGSLGEESSSSTPAVDSASPSIRDSESQSESSATPVNTDSPITPEPDLGAKAESDVVEEVSTHTAAVPQDVDGDNDNDSEEVLHLTTQAESEEAEVAPTHTAAAADVIVVGNDSDEVPHPIAQAESEEVEDVLLHTTAVQVADDDNDELSTVRRQSYGSLLNFIAQVESEDLEARAHAAPAVADDDDNNEVSTSRRNSYDSCLSMLERYFEKPWFPSNRRISGQSFRSTQDYFFGELPCAWSDSDSVVLPPPSEAESESKDERPLYGNSDSESDAESVPRREYDPSEIPNITVWDLINLDMGSDASDSDDDSEDPFVAFNTVEDEDVFVSRRHASRRLGVYGQEQLHARSLSLPVMSTARTATGPRPLLLPMLVAHREGSIQASSSFPSSSGHS